MADFPPPSIVHPFPSANVPILKIPKTVSIGYGDKRVTFDFDKDPVTVTVSPAMTMDEAGKLLLNSTADLVGSPEPFPDNH